MDFDFASHITAGQRRLYAYIHSLVDSSAAAWDVLQETNVVLWRKRDEFQPGTNFQAWAFAVARFQVKAFLRDRNRDPMTVMTPDLLDLVAEDAEAEAGEFDDRMAALERCKELLSARSHSLVELYYERDQSVKQVGADLQMTVDSVKQALFRVRRFLQDCIEGRTATPEAR